MVVMHIALQSKTSMSCLWATIRCINIVMTLVVTLCRNNRPTRSSNAISQLDPLVLKHDGDGAVNNDPVRKTRPVFAFPDRCARAVHSKSFPMNVLALFFFAALLIMIRPFNCWELRRSYCAVPTGHLTFCWKKG
jgi:hypothetical protein